MVIDLMNKLVVETCCTCSMQFAMPQSFQQQRKDDHKSFYCPHGHAQSYTGKTEAERLREELDRTTRRLDSANAEIVQNRETLEHQARRISAAHGQITKLKNRAAAGVCPCCKQHFPHLQQHMKAKHPDYAEGAAK